MTNKKIQLLHIHGAEAFPKYEQYLEYLKTRNIYFGEKLRWHNQYLKREIGDEIEILKTQMPNKENAFYDEWKIHFERMIEYLNDNVILLGTSLGGIFLAKYLAENDFPKKIFALYLVCTPYDDTHSNCEMRNDFNLPEDLSKLEKQCNNIKFLFSADDEIVPLYHLEEYKKKLPNCDYIVYEGKNGHFRVEEFPEFVELIRNDLK